LVLIYCIDCTIVFIQRDVLKCDYLLNCRMEFNNMMLREICVSKLHMLTGGGENCNEI
jgi:hypothetical protein